jgi:DDE superfamily endonuclease/Helix-turn-helix of DDE superfamily endonuclease
MKRWEQMQDVNDDEFLRQVGVPRVQFETILEKIQTYLDAERTRNRMKNRGVNTTRLPVEDRLLLTFYYLRHHPTFQNLGDVFGISQGYANKRYHEYLDMLVKVLRLPGRKALRDETWRAVIIDVTEQPIERPGTKQGHWFSGKKKRHTAKIQLIVCLFTLQILSVAWGKGRMADFRLFKESSMPLADALEKYADAGYQGLDKLIEHAFTPIKKPRNGELTKAERAYNRALAKLRVRIEHVNRRCKIFRVTKEVYRGNRRHFHKTWTVVAALVNYRYAE